MFERTRLVFCARFRVSVYYSFLFNYLFTLIREHSPLGEGSLYSWSPVQHDWNWPMKEILFYLYLVKQSNATLLNWRPAIQWCFPQRWVFSTFILYVFFRLFCYFLTVALTGFELATFSLLFLGRPLRQHRVPGQGFHSHFCCCFLVPSRISVTGIDSLWSQAVFVTGLSDQLV